MKNFYKCAVNEINEWSRSIGEYLKGFLDDYTTRRMQEEEIAGFWQLNQALVMQVSLSLRSVPMCEERTGTKFSKFFSGFSLIFFFLSNQIFTSPKFNKIEQIKGIKLTLGSFRLKRICFGKPVPLTWWLDQIHCSENSVTSFIALSAS